MKKICIALAASAALAACGTRPAQVPAASFGGGNHVVETFDTGKGVLEIALIKHGTLALRHGETVIQVDPVAGFGKPTDYGADFGTADFILVTHEHGDHLCDSTIAVLTGEQTKILLNRTSRDQIGRGEVIGNGERRRLTEDILLEAVPAYNTTPGREHLHPQGGGNGYVLTVGDLRVYIAGDTEDVPEMADLKDIDVAFLPVNQPYTMTVEQAVRAAQAFRPKVLFPYHFGQTDVSVLPELLPDIDVRLREMQ